MRTRSCPPNHKRPRFYTTWTLSRLRSSSRTDWKLRKVICDREPWRFTCNVNMELRSNTGVVIQGSKRQAIIRSLAKP